MVKNNIINFVPWKISNVFNDPRLQETFKKMDKNPKPVIYHLRKNSNKFDMRYKTSKSLLPPDISAKNEKI